MPKKICLVDVLERRCLLAASFTSVTSKGTLIVNGTTNNDVITISMDEANVTARVNGKHVAYPVSLIKRISVSGFKGDDRLINDTALRATLAGAGGRDTLVGGTFADSLDGGEALDLVDYSKVDGGVVINIDGGDGVAFRKNQPDDSDVLTSTEIINGTNAADTFNYAGGVTLRGLDGGDRFREIDLSSKPALIDAGGGNDSIELRSSAATTIRGGSGNDQIALDFAAKPALIDGGSGNDDISLRGNLNESLDFSTNISVESIDDVGDVVAQSIIGSTTGERIAISETSAFGCTILAGGGNDTLVSGPGADSLVGGKGSDTVDYYNSTVPVSFSINRIADSHGKTVASSATAGQTVDQLGGDIENYVGTTQADNFLVTSGFYLAQSPFEIVLDARGGNDYLAEDGSNVRITMIGGAGKDKFVCHEDCDTTVLGGSGDDVITSAAANAFAAGTDQVDLGPGNDTLDLYGELDGAQKNWNLANFANTENVVNISAGMAVTGDNNSNLLSFIDPHAAGPCTIIGNGGNDTIIGSADADSLVGGTGDDSINGHGGGDFLDGGPGNNVVK